MIRLSIIITAHDEGKLIKKCLSAIIKSDKPQDTEIFIICDRCTSLTKKVIKDFPFKIVEKDWANWNNKSSETYNYGISISKGDIIALTPADINVEKDYFMKLIKWFEDDNVAAVSGILQTDPSTIMNKLMRIWEYTHRIKLYHEPRGCAAIRKKYYHHVGGFKDVEAEDSELYRAFRKHGWKTFVDSNTRAKHMRPVKLKKIIRRQIISGRERSRMNQKFLIVLGHSIVRLRPLVFISYLLSKIRCKIKKVTV